jgi:DNA-binding response OmpR family regulator
LRERPTVEVTFVDMMPRILLVDDNPAWQEALAEYLRRKGFFVLEARDAASGLAVLERQPVTLIVCDYDLPDMNGLELVRLLRQLHRDAAVLMLSGEPDRSLAARALAAGALGFVEKSAAPTILLGRIRQLLDDACARHAATRALPLWQRLLPNPYRHARKPPRPARGQHLARFRCKRIAQDPAAN